MPRPLRWRRLTRRCVSSSSVTTTLAAAGSTAGAAVSTVPAPFASAAVTAPGRSEKMAGAPMRRSVTVALPAYTAWRAMKPSPCTSKEVTSEASVRSSPAATRGARSRPSAEAAKNAAR